MMVGVGPYRHYAFRPTDRPLQQTGVTEALTWTFAVGAPGVGTANADLGLTAQTYTATNPSSVDYFNCWQGNVASRPKTDQMNQVILYFQQLGYTIERLKNTATNKTLKWKISY